MKREDFLQVIWQRMSEVEGVSTTARNPVDWPEVDELPRINIFDMEEDVEEGGSRRTNRCKLTIVIEAFINASEENAGSKELATFMQKVLGAMYTTGLKLLKNRDNGVSMIKETRRSRVLRPPVGEPVFGLGIFFEIYYAEDISDY